MGGYCNASPFTVVSVFSWIDLLFLLFRTILHLGEQFSESYRVDPFQAIYYSIPLFIASVLWFALTTIPSYLT